MQLEHLAPVDEPADVLAVLCRHPEVHPYGIADVAQLWDGSRWWVDGEAVLGVIDVPGSPVPVVYAVSATALDATLDLAAALAPALPDHFIAHGPVGLAEHLTATYTARFAVPHVKMHLVEATMLPADDGRSVVLTRDDAPALRALFAADPIAGDFFHPALLDSGLYFGRWDGETLIAAGGIHVIDTTHGVAAIANVATHPARRRRGLGRAVVTTLSHRLLERVPVVGLNVRLDNTPALSLYQSLGFATIIPYEETELLRRPGPERS